VELSKCVPREEGDYLYSLVRHYKPAVTLEVGLANGLSALFMTAAHRDNGGNGMHIAIDPFQRTDWQNVGVQLMERAGLGDRLRLVELSSHQALPDLEREGVKVGLAFIDGAHLTDYVFCDFLGTDRLLEVGGLMAFDDSDWPAVKPAIRYAISNRGYEPAHPEVVVQPPTTELTAKTRALRWAAGRVEGLGSRMRPEFMKSDAELGIEGRCVVLRKTREDTRDSQNPRSHYDF
jgi:predicted O-methyltransferase YrrM